MLLDLELNPHEFFEGSSSSEVGEVLDGLVVELVDHVLVRELGSVGSNNGKGEERVLPDGSVSAKERERGSAVCD